MEATKMSKAKLKGYAKVVVNNEEAYEGSSRIYTIMRKRS